VPVKRIDADKKAHPGEVMRITFTPDRDFYGVCPTCDGYAPLSDEQAGNGKAQCFGEVILVSWNP
jgi:hypothetical protein